MLKKFHKKNLTDKEAGVVSIMRLNDAMPKQEWRRDWFLRGYKISYHRRAKNNFWGRFGGGWNWKLGFQSGGSTIIISLLIAEISIRKADKTAKPAGG